MTLFDLIEPQRNLLTSDVNICGDGRDICSPKIPGEGSPRWRGAWVMTMLFEVALC